MRLEVERKRLFSLRTRVVVASQMRQRRDALRRDLPNATRGLLRLTVAAEFGVDVAMMQGPRRFPALIEARFAYVLVSRRRLKLSTPRIGDALGGRDHTTILHALRRAEAREAVDPDFAACLHRIEAELWPEQTDVALSRLN